jgi:hypothetical protein
VSRLGNQLPIQWEAVELAARQEPRRTMDRPVIKLLLRALLQVPEAEQDYQAAVVRMAAVAPVQLAEPVPMEVREYLD